MNDIWIEKAKFTLSEQAHLIETLKAGQLALLERANKAETELSEADRRAGAAERYLEYYKDSESRRDSWLREAKEAWGVHCNTSFDVVWNECLQLKQERDNLKAENEQLQKVCDDLAKWVNTSEWNRPNQAGIRQCPSCNKMIYLNDAKTHYKDCELAKALASYHVIKSKGQQK